MQYGDAFTEDMPAAHSKVGWLSSKRSASKAQTKLTALEVVSAEGIEPTTY